MNQKEINLPTPTPTIPRRNINHSKLGDNPLTNPAMVIIEQPNNEINNN